MGVEIDTLSLLGHNSLPSHAIDFKLDSLETRLKKLSNKKRINP